jgi:hypothetical protein
MTEFVKQMLNREFTDAVGWLEDQGQWWSPHTFNEYISLYFETPKSEGGGGYLCARPWSVDAVCEEEYQKGETHIKFVMIKKIEREAQLGAVIVPLQIKIKKMLYSPHNRRGRAFIDKQIDWAF